MTGPTLADADIALQDATRSMTDECYPAAKIPETISVRREILDEARRVVTGDRETTYGGPEQSFSTIAQLWSVYLGITVQAHDVAALLALLKLARLQHSQGQHRDSWVDLAGYAACGAECALGNGI